MKTKLFTLFFALAASAGTMFAEKVQIGDLYYDLNSKDKTAEVTYERYMNENNYKGLTTANIPASVTYSGTTYSVTSIGEYAFYYCSSLTSVTIPNSVTWIGKNAFDGCRSLTSVAIPYSVTSIGNYAFYNCSSLTSVTIPNSVTSIGERAFCDCSSLTSVAIPYSVTSIGEGAFQSCSSLTFVTIPNSVTRIGDDAFRGCSGLTSVTIPNRVTSIGYGVFWGCSSLTSVTIPNSVTSIGEWAFYYCSGLTSVTIPNRVTSIGSSAFSGCSSLTSIIVENGNSFYDSRNNCNAIIKTATNTLIVGCMNTIIPNSVTSIGSEAFYNCSSLTSVTIPNSVTSIGYQAFYGCSSLTSVTIPNSVTSISGGAFYNCSSLTSVAIPNSVTSIGDGAFRDCRSLTSVTIPNRVTSIGSSAFSGCSSLTSVTIPNSVTSIGYGVFWGCSSLTSVYNYATTPQAIDCYEFYEVNINTCTLYVPKESVDLYNAAGGWKDFKNILPLAAEGVETESTTVETSETTAEITWLEVSGAYTYELIIRDKNGNIVCTLIFNANGQLTEIAFGAPGRDNSTQASGFSFTVTGLEAGTSYDLTITAKNDKGEVLQTTTQSFTTADVPSAVDNISTDGVLLRKMLIDGQLLILRDGKTYTIQGVEVR